MRSQLANSEVKRGMIVTNSRLTSVARDALAEWSDEPGPELRVIDGDELTTLLLRHPEIVRRYFAGSSKNG